MKKLWLSYAWSDNTQQDVDYVAQQIQASDIAVKHDRFVLGAGQRLWEQIERHIVSPDESDAWALYATQNSLLSQACREELAYALDRALSTRGSNFPLIGIFPASVEHSLIPSAIRTRLFVSLEDADWLERVRSGVRGDVPRIASPVVAPYALQIHRGVSTFMIEVRPRAGHWAPVLVGMPAAEVLNDSFALLGASGIWPLGGVLMGVMMGERDGWKWQVINEAATPTRSCFVDTPVLPSQLLFGQDGGPHWVLTRDQLEAILPV